jgi:hypothetical protein
MPPFFPTPQKTIDSLRVQAYTAELEIEICFQFQTKLKKTKKQGEAICHQARLLREVLINVF